MMAGKTRQAGSKDLIPAQAVACLAGVLAPCDAALAFSGNFAPVSYVGTIDPNVIWEILIGGVVICAFLASVALWIHSALRRVKRLQARKNAFVSSALNMLALPPLLARTVFRTFFIKMGFVRFITLVTLIQFMASLPIKMVLRWTMNLKYIVAVPEIFFNI